MSCKKEFLFGLRSPTSIGLGKWDGAFVSGITSEGKLFSALFVDNMDFVTDSTLTIDTIRKTYDELKNKG
jgi:hypothetical protein